MHLYASTAVTAKYLEVEVDSTTGTKVFSYIQDGAIFLGT